MTTAPIGAGAFGDGEEQVLHAAVLLMRSAIESVRCPVTPATQAQIKSLFRLGEERLLKQPEPAIQPPSSKQKAAPDLFEDLLGAWEAEQRAKTQQQELRESLRRDLETLRQQPSSSVHILRTRELLEPGQELRVPIAWIGKHETAPGRFTYVLRLDRPEFPPLFPASAAIGWCRRNLELLRPEIERRILAMEPVDLWYVVTDYTRTTDEAGTITEHFATDVHKGPSWDAWSL